MEALQNGGLLDSVLACQEDSSDMSGCWTALFLANRSKTISWKDSGAVLSGTATGLGPRHLPRVPVHLSPTWPTLKDLSGLSI